MLRRGVAGFVIGVVSLAFSGKPDDGAGSLEKAMRLDPRSLWLWYWRLI